MSRVVKYHCPVHGALEISIPDDLPEGVTFSVGCSQCLNSDARMEPPAESGSKEI